MNISTAVSAVGLNAYRVKNTGLFRSINTAASGMTAESLRIDVISNNIANVNTTRTPEGGAYRRKDVIFEPRSFYGYEFDVPRIQNMSDIYELAGTGVRVVDITADTKNPMRLVYNPDHPDAFKYTDFFNEDGTRKEQYKNLSDEEFDKLASKIGYVEFPNVNVVSEMVDMITATRAYEANVTTIKSAKAMFMKALELGR
ncbi:MAG TPA: flagellar basal body rod protein FlgC [bacterium]|nr:flagellar basal body rod protein FlgC [bacterium]